MALTSLLPRRKRRSDIRLQRDYEDLYPAFVREMDKLLGRFFNSFGNEPFGELETMEGDFMPSIDVKENKKEIKVTVELPGMDEDDIDITLSKDALTIRGEKKEETEDSGKDYYRMERRFGAFYRTLSLPAEVDESKVDARFKKGVLTIRLPKSAEAQKQRRKIQIVST
jgi:HSP20 family protein